jgi:molecular chaperone HtpG
MRSLKQYVAELKPNQTAIYFLAGDSIERLKSNPKLESAAARGIEVLLLTDPVDAFWTSAQLDFEGKPLKSLSQGDVDFGLIPMPDEHKKDETKSDADEAMVIAVIKSHLGERVSDVRASQRLTASASCLVAGSHGPDRELERLLARANRGVGSKPVLEVNLRHPLVASLPQAGDAAADLSFLLLEQAQILDGELPDDPAAFANRLNRLVAKGLPKT